jgi:hypothetical protein
LTVVHADAPGGVSLDPDEARRRSTEILLQEPATPLVLDGRCLRQGRGYWSLHDDPAREFAYTAGANEALKQADREGCTVVSVKNDWATVFATDEIDGEAGPSSR